MRMQTAARLSAGASLGALACATSAPRGLAGRVQAAGRDPAAVVSELTSAFSEFKAGHKNEMEAIQATVDEIATRYSIGRLNGGAWDGDDGLHATDPEYSRLYSSWFRSGADEHDVKAQNVQGGPYAAMSVGDNEAGGQVSADLEAFRIAMGRAPAQAARH